MDFKVLADSRTHAPPAFVPLFLIKRHHVQGIKSAPYIVEIHISMRLLKVLEDGEEILVRVQVQPVKGRAF